MTSCCARASPPLVLHPLHLDQPSKSQALPKLPAELLDDKFCPVPSSDISVLLENIRVRQETLFEQVLDRQKSFAAQLAAVQSDIKAVANEKENPACKSLDSSVKVVQKDTEIEGAENVLTASGELQSQGALEPKDRDKIDLYIPGSSSEAAGTDVPGRADQQDAEVEGEENEFTSSDEAKSEDDVKPGQNDKPGIRMPGTAELKHNSLQTKDLEQSPSNQLKKSLMRAHSAYEEDAEGRFAALSRLLHSTQFEMAVAAAIMINAFIMCWESQYQGLDVGFNLEYPGRKVRAHVVWAGATTVFKFFDWFFGCVFLLEMVAKITCWRSKYFFRAEDIGRANNNFLKNKHGPSCIHSIPFMSYVHGLQVWNLLDFVTAASFLFDKVAASGLINPQTMRLVRLLRLGRLVRLLRYLEGMDHLYVMTTAISGLKVVLTWATLLLSLMLLTSDLLLVQTLQATYFDKVKASDLTEEQLRKHHQMYEYFGTCTRCMLSMFEITLGNWPPIARLLSEEVSEWFTVVCLFHKLTIGFAVVGVITGCILQETFKVAQTDDIIMFRQKQHAAKVFREKMKALFGAVDCNLDGDLSLSEFIDALNASPEIKIWLASLNIETNDLHMLFDLLDVNGDGKVTLEELLIRMPHIQGQARSIDVLAIMKAMAKNHLHSDNKHPERGDTRSSFADFLMPEVQGDNGSK